MGDASPHDAVIGWLVQAAAVASVLDTPEGVEAVERWENSRRLLFLLNHAEERCEVALPSRFTDLLTGRAGAQGSLDSVRVMACRTGLFSYGPAPAGPLACAERPTTVGRGTAGTGSKIEEACWRNSGGLVLPSAVRRSASPRSDCREPFPAVR